MLRTYPSSASPLVPLSATYPYDLKTDITISRQQYTDGYTIVVNPLFTGINDVKINNDTLMFMSSTVGLTDIWGDRSQDLTVVDLAGYVVIKASNGKYFKNVNDTIYASATSTNDATFFRITENTDGTIKLVKDNKLATVSRTLPYNITLEPQYANDIYVQQKFDYYLNSNRILIATKFVNPYGVGPSIIKRFLTYSLVNEQVRATGVISDDDWSIHNNYYLEIVPSVEDLATGFNNITHWIKYYNQLNNKSHNKDTTLEQDLTGLKLNFLISCPLKTKIDLDQYTATAKIGSLNINVSNLKNYETPEYEFARAPYLSGDLVLSDFSNANALKRREYTKIFAGSNQDYGYDHPFLGFTAYTAELLFEKDRTTYFHYPSTAPTLPLSAAGLIESGAVWGTTPYRSDKVWKRLADYEYKTYWGKANTPYEHGVWLCSWLSGNCNPDSVPVWKDRWYNPGYVSYQFAVSATTQVYITGHDPIIWDEDSVFTFEPGGWYKYFHVGDTFNETVVRTLTGEGNNLKLHFDDWAQTVDDLSPYENDGELLPYTAGMVLPKSVNSSRTDTCLFLNGTNTCLVPYNSSYNPTSAISFSIWARADDWTDFRGGPIVSNLLRGGWELKQQRGFFTPILPICEQTYGHILLTNIDGHIYYDTILPYTESAPLDVNSYGTPSVINVDGNLYTWVLDTNKNRLYKVDYKGDIIDQVIFSDGLDLTDIAIDSKNNVHVLDRTVSTTPVVSALDTFGNLISTSTLPNLRRVMDFNTNNVLYSRRGLDICIDNNQIEWYVNMAGNLYRDDISVASSYGLYHIKCDRNNYIWGLGHLTSSNKDVLYKFNNTGSLILSADVATNVTSVCAMGLTIVDEWYEDSYVDRIWVTLGSTQKMYKYDTNCNYIEYVQLTKGINLAEYLYQTKSNMSFGFNGDNSGYEWYRKFVYNKYNQHPQIEGSIILGSAVEPTYGKVTTNFDVSGLVDKEWHLFTVTYNQSLSTLNLYVDAVLRDTKNITGTPQIYYEYENSLYLGQQVSQAETIDSDLNIDYSRSILKLDDFRIYNHTINNSDIRHIYMLKQDFVDLIWNVPIGTKNYIEEVERFFKHKLPGMKSQFYNIRIIGLDITNTDTRNTIEEIIKGTIQKLAPAYSHLYRIIWE